MISTAYFLCHVVPPARSEQGPPLNIRLLLMLLTRTSSSCVLHVCKSNSLKKKKKRETDDQKLVQSCFMKLHQLVETKPG